MAVCSETVARMDAGPKPTGMYLRRVSEHVVVSQVGPAVISVLGVGRPRFYWVAV